MLGVYQVQIETFKGTWRNAWGEDFRSFEEAVTALDEHLDDLDTVGLDYERNEFRIHFIEGVA